MVLAGRASVSCRRRSRVNVSPFGTELRQSIEENLDAHTPRLSPTDGHKPAGVALIVTADESGEPALLLTRRSPRLKGHSGQWALPGGRVDIGESAFEAAVREAAEEINLSLGRNDLLGRLDDYRTRSGYVMSAFVFWAVDTDDMRPNPGEVESIHHVPFSELLRPDSPRFIEIPESDRPVLQIPLYDREIHAPTAALLYQFRLLCLEADPSPVAHFEQPLFAWR